MVVTARISLVVHYNCLSNLTSRRKSEILLLHNTKEAHKENTQLQLTAKARSSFQTCSPLNHSLLRKT